MTPTGSNICGLAKKEQNTHYLPKIQALGPNGTIFTRGVRTP